MGYTSYSGLSSTGESGEGLANNVPPSPTKSYSAYSAHSFAGPPTNVFPTRVRKMIQPLVTIPVGSLCKDWQTMQMQGHVAS